MIINTPKNNMFFYIKNIFRLDNKILERFNLKLWHWDENKVNY